ncbi:MAG: hypothetical protein ACHQQ3_13060 [Gemmatimonadales bacterium]
MSDLRLRARTVSELVDAAFALYRRNAMQYIVVSALAISPLLVFQLVVPAAATPTLQNLGTSLFAVEVISMLTYALMSAVVVKLGSQAYLGEVPDVANTVREVLPRVPSVIVGGILMVPLLFLGLLAFFVGVLYVVSRWFAVSTVIVLEGKGPLEAFGRSSVLSSGRKRHILNTLILVGLIYVVLAMGVSAFSVLFGSRVIALVISTAFTIVAYPVFALTQMLLYYDARIRGEGFDLERMADALGAPAAAQA